MRCFSFLLIILVSFPFVTSAQQIADKGQSDRMIQQICMAAGELNSLQCDFRQIKQLPLLKTSMVSTGKMYYKEGRFLRWEYVAPYSYTFILNEDKAIVKSNGKTDVISVRSSKLFQQIARIMMNSITGKCLSDEGDFNVAMFVADEQWIAKLVPKQEELAQFFEQIQLFIDSKRQMVTIVELIEKGGDVTQIKLQNIVENAIIDDKMFSATTDRK